MINRVVAVGRLTKDPLLSKTMSGISTCTFTLAVNRRNQVAGQPDADFIQCVTWRKQPKTSQLTCIKVLSLE